jgi:hypothetical protein
MRMPSPDTPQTPENGGAGGLFGFGRFVWLALVPIESGPALAHLRQQARLARVPYTQINRPNDSD